MKILKVKKKKFVLPNYHIVSTNTLKYKIFCCINTSLRGKQELKTKVKQSSK